jgi:hypothetical protein
MRFIANDVTYVSVNDNYNLYEVRTSSSVNHEEDYGGYYTADVYVGYSDTGFSRVLAGQKVYY